MSDQNQHFAGATRAPRPEETLPERGLGVVFSSIVGEAQTLAKDVKALGQVEFKTIGKFAGIGVGLLVGAGITALCMLALIFTGSAYGVARLLGGETFEIFLGFFIVAGVMLIITIILALIGITNLKKVKSPEKTIAAAKQASTSVQHAIARGVGKARTDELTSANFDESTS